MRSKILRRVMLILPIAIFSVTFLLSLLRLTVGYGFFGPIVMFQSAVGVIAVIIPRLLHRGFGLAVPLPLLTVYTVFILGTVLFGEIFEGYYLLAVWDDLMHGVGGFLLFSLGLSVSGGFNVRGGGVSCFRLAFALCFALFTGVTWEVVEFFSDGVFGTNMQKFMAMGADGALYPLIGRAAVTDTMVDLIVDTLGAVAGVLPAAFIPGVRDRLLSWLTVYPAKGAKMGDF